MILVTGATGFVGTALVAELSRRQIAHRAVSRAPRPGHVAVGTMDTGTVWGAALSGVDTIIHLAGRVHVMDDTTADPLSAFRAVNVLATLNLARQAADLGVRRFIFVSSIKVNGEGTHAGYAFTADDAPAPQDPYGQSKLEAEEALFELGRKVGLEIVVVRPPLVYGPGVKANFAALIRLVRLGVPLPLGSVRNKRSFVFVGNLVDLLIHCLTYRGAVGKVILATDGRDLSTPELLTFMAQALEKSPRLFPFPPTLLRAFARLVDKQAVAGRLLDSLQVDISKTRQELGWSPPFDVRVALQLTMQPNNHSLDERQ